MRIYIHSKQRSELLTSFCDNLMLVFPMPHVQDSNRSNNLFIAFCHLTSHSYNLSFRESVEGERERESVSQTKNLQHTSHIQNGSDVPALVTGQYMKYN